jgi:hypothetical protein
LGVVHEATNLPRAPAHAAAPAVLHRAEQQRADAWLQEFRNAAESWALCLELLANPSCHEPEAYFAANTLRVNCGRSVQLVNVEVTAQLFPGLVSCLLLAVASNKWCACGCLRSACALNCCMT